MLTKTKFLQIAVAALLLLNLGTLAWFRFGHRPPRPGESLKNRAIERLHFDTGQTAAYEKLIEQHRSAVRAKEAEILAAKKRLYAGLKGGDFPEKDTLVLQIGQLQTEIEHIHFTHFQEMKNLCRPDQIADFQNFVDELSGFLSPPPPPPGK